MATNDELEKRIVDLEAFKKSFQTGNGLDRSTETSLRNRLADIAKDYFIFGQATFSGGKVDITDVRITSKSKGFATRMDSSASMTGRQELAGGYLSGHTWRFFEGSFTETYNICYLIIP